MPMSNAHFLAVACDIHGAELAEGYTGDCIEIAIDESMEIWDGCDALYSVRVYRVSNDEDGNPTHECVHEECVNNNPPVMLD